MKLGRHLWIVSYSLAISTSSGRMRDVNYKLKWKNKDRTAAGITLHLHFLHCLTTWSVKQEYHSPYTITGFTELRVHCQPKKDAIIYRANDYYYGKGWYDWALVEDPKNANITYIGKILGFSSTPLQVFHPINTLRLMVTKKTML